MISIDIVTGVEQGILALSHTKNGVLQVGVFADSTTVQVMPEERRQCVKSLPSTRFGPLR